MTRTLIRANATSPQPSAHRTEHDLLGQAQVPHTAYYGIQTQRAMSNFQLSGIAINQYPELLRALAMVKQAAAQANHQLGSLADDKADAISHACQAIINGQYAEQFTVDLIQGGAGTSTNMNANEVIANIGLEYLGRAKGDYQYLHPNNDVNQSQSTNDVYPTAVRLAIIFSAQALIDPVQSLVAALHEKAEAFAAVLKMGRTQLQDAVPMTLGQEFRAYAITLNEDCARINEACDLLKEINLGGTAIGTGINTPEHYAALAVKKLAALSGLAVSPAHCLVEATSDRRRLKTASVWSPR